MGVVVRRYIDFLILLIPTPLVSVLFCSSIPTFCSFLKCFSFLLLLRIQEFSPFSRDYETLMTFYVLTWVIIEFRWNNSMYPMLPEPIPDK